MKDFKKLDVLVDAENQLDLALGHIDNVLINLSAIGYITDDVTDETSPFSISSLVERIDFGAIVSLRNQILSDLEDLKDA